MKKVLSLLLTVACVSLAAVPAWAEEPVAAEAAVEAEDVVETEETAVEAEETVETVTDTDIEAEEPVVETEIDEPEAIIAVEDEEAAPAPETIPESEEPAKTDSAAASSGVCGDNLTWNLDNSGTLTISGTGPMKWDTRPWTDVKDSIKIVVIEEGVTSLYSEAFYACYNITQVVLPSTLTALGGQAFGTCLSLTEIVIPEGITQINPYAFYNCQSLRSVILPQSVETIGWDAFDRCFELKNLELPNGLKTISNNAFAYSGLTSISLPDSVTTIEYSAFDYCESLCSVRLPAGLTEIPSSLFRYCTRLTSVEIPKSVTTIRYSAFLGCTALKEIEVPASVTEIETEALGYDYVDGSGQASTLIPNFRICGYTDSAAQTYAKANNIAFVPIGGTCGENATWYYSNGTLTISGSGETSRYGSVYVSETDEYIQVDQPWLSVIDRINRVVVEEGITKIGTDAFSGAGNLREVSLPDSLKGIESNAFAYCSSLTEIDLPELTDIGAAFKYCTSLRSIVIPKGVSFLTNEMFTGCTSLESVVFEEGSAPWYIGWCTFFGCTSLMSITIPSSVTGLNETAFGRSWSSDGSGQVVLDPNFVIYGTKYSNAWDYAKRLGITFVEIGESISFDYDETTRILTIRGNCAISDYPWNSEGENTNTPWADFAGEVKEVVIEEGITAVGDYAFSGMKSLEKVTIPSSVKDLYAGCFLKCEKLTDVQLAEGLENVGVNTFRQCTALEEIRLPESVIVIDEYAFDGDTALRSINFPKNLKTIGYAAFGRCTALKEVVLPATLTQEGEYGTEIYPFDESGLEKAVFADGCKEIPERFFGYCSSLKEVQIPDGVTSIGEGAFIYCYALESIQLPDSVTEIGGSAFDTCIALKNIRIPNGVTALKQGVLSWCKALESVEIPDSVTTIGRYAFSNSDQLKNIKIPASVTTIEDYALGYMQHYDSDVGGIVMDGLIEGFSISGYAGTAAETYAQENGIPFVRLKRTPVLTFAQTEIQKQLDDLAFVNPLTAVTDGAITYSSSNAAVAAVDAQSGEVTVGGVGTAVIFAFAAEGTGYLASEPVFYTVNVSAIPVAGAAVKLKTTSFTYNGTERKPTVTSVILGETTLDPENDYEVTYSNNKNAGTGTVTITGKGKYKGTVKKTFTIKAKAVTPTVTLSKTSYVYNANVKKPGVTVKAGSTKLTTASYTVKYANGRKTPGKYAVTVTLKGNYSGKKTVYFKIVPQATTLSTLKKGNAKGTATKSAFTVKWAKKTTQTTGYQIQYSTSSTFASGNKTVLVTSNKTTSKTVTSLKAGKKYYVRIRTYKLVNGVKYWSAWSAKKSVTLAK